MMRLGVPVNINTIHRIDNNYGKCFKFWVTISICGTFYIIYLHNFNATVVSKLFSIKIQQEYISLLKILNCVLNVTMLLKLVEMLIIISIYKKWLNCVSIIIILKLKYIITLLKIRKST